MKATIKSILPGSDFDPSNKYIGDLSHFNVKAGTECKIVIPEYDKIIGISFMSEASGHEVDCFFVYRSQLRIHRNKK